VVIVGREARRRRKRFTSITNTLVSSRPRSLASSSSTVRRGGGPDTRPPPHRATHDSRSMTNASERDAAAEDIDYPPPETAVPSPRGEVPAQEAVPRARGDKGKGKNPAAKPPASPPSRAHKNGGESRVEAVERPVAASAASRRANGLFLALLLAFGYLVLKDLVAITKPIRAIAEKPISLASWLLSPLRSLIRESSTARQDADGL